MKDLSKLFSRLIVVFMLVSMGVFVVFSAPLRTEPSGRLMPVSMTSELKTNLIRYGMTAGRFVRMDSTDKTGRERPCSIGYVLYVPKRGMGGAVPMVVCVPGRGEIGVDLSRQFNQRGLFNKVTSETFQRRHPCYLLSLSPPTSVHTLIDSLPGRPSTIQTLLADAVREIVRSCRSPKIDRKRIYLTGFSYGGAAVYGLMTSFPELFACGIPVATFPPPPMFAVYPFRIWHLYNEGDYQAHRLSGTMLAPFADALTNVGGEFRSGTFAAAGHDAWRAAWNEDAVWEWAFAQGVKKSKFASESTNRATVVLKSSTSVASVALHGPDRAIDGLYGTWFESKRPAQRGDYLMVDFGSPIRKRISVFGWRSADIPPPRLQISVSRIGKSWTRIGLVSEKTGERSFVPASAVRFLRVAVDSDSSAPLRIREVRVSAP